MRAKLLALIEAGGGGLAPYVIEGARRLDAGSYAKPSYYGPLKA